MWKGARGMRRPSTATLVLAGLMVIAFVLRAAGVLGQSIWLDEDFTRRVVDGDLKHMLRTTAATESNSALFYGLDWIVTQVLGIGDRTLRLVPLAAGVGSVPLAYLLGRRLRDDVSGLILAAIVAVHPLLVWYGVEARAYSLFVLLSLSTLLCFVALLQAEREHGRWVALWAISAAAMALSHYFGAFIVAAQLLWLLVARPGIRQAVGLAVAGFVVVGVAAAPLWAIQDNGRTEFISRLPFRGRLDNWAHEAAVGMSVPDLPLAPFVWIGAAAAIGAALHFTARGADRDRRETLAVAGTTLLAIALSVAFAKDFLLGRNMIGVWPGVAALVAVGLAALPRKVVALPALLIAVPALIATGGLITEPTLQRPDFKGLAQALGPPRDGQIVVISGDYSALPLGYYLHLDPQPPEVAVPATEIIAVGEHVPLARRDCISGALCNIGRALPLNTPLEGEDLAGVRLVERRRVGYWDIATYRSPRPVGIRQDVSGRIFSNPRGPQRYVRGTPPSGAP